MGVCVQMSEPPGSGGKNETDGKSSFVQITGGWYSAAPEICCSMAKVVLHGSDGLIFVILCMIHIHDMIGFSPCPACATGGLCPAD